MAILLLVIGVLAAGMGVRTDGTATTAAPWALMFAGLCVTLAVVLRLVEMGRL